MWESKIKFDQTNAHWSITMVILRLKLKELKMFSPCSLGEMGHLHFGHMARVSQRKGAKGLKTLSQALGSRCPPGHVSPGRSDSRKQAGGHRKCLGNFTEQLKLYVNEALSLFCFKQCSIQSVTQLSGPDPRLTKDNESFSIDLSSLG